ncbi:MAG TPA: hypothetical protein VK928_08060 [Longimicrobiales bacterium]|nr:hypothetical protein [Longimicrobiales bacterium]
MLSTLLALFLIGIAAIIALSLIGSLLGFAFSLVGLLLFKILPILVIGYIVLRLIAPKRKVSAEDEEWINT